MSLLAKYLVAVHEARGYAMRCDRLPPRYLAIHEEEINELIRELRAISARPALGFDRKKMREQIEDGKMELFGLRVIIRERVVA